MLRNAIAFPDLDGFAESLKKVADIGYPTVQISATCPFEPQWLKEQLDKNGLKCVVTHTPAAQLKEMLSQWQVYVIAFMRLLKLEMLLLPTLMGQDCQPGAAMAFITSILCCITIPLCLLFFGIKI